MGICTGTPVGIGLIFECRLPGTLLWHFKYKAWENSRDFHALGQQKLTFSKAGHLHMNTCKLASQEIIKGNYSSKYTYFCWYYCCCLYWTPLTLDLANIWKLFIPRFNNSKQEAALIRCMQYYRQTPKGTNICLLDSILHCVDMFDITSESFARKHLWDSEADNVKHLINLHSSDN